MATYRTDVYGPTTSAPSVTGRYAVCEVCHTQWQVKSEDDADAKGCHFCGAGEAAIRVFTEGT